MRRGAWLIVAALGAACRQDAAQPDVAAIPAASSPMRVSPLPSALPLSSASSQAPSSVPLVKRSAPRGEQEDAAWDILAGRRPAGELPVESYGPELPSAPMGDRDPSAPPLEIVEVALDLSPGLPREKFLSGAERRGLRYRFCYEDALRDAPGLEGDVIVSFSLDERGRVDGAKAVGRTAATASLAACVAEAAERTYFPRGHGPAQVKATYSFKLGSVR